MKGFELVFIGCGAKLQADPKQPKYWKAALAKHMRRCAKCQAARLTIGKILKEAGASQ